MAAEQRPRDVQYPQAVEPQAEPAPLVVAPNQPPPAERQEQPQPAGRVEGEREGNVELENLKRELQTLKKSMEDMTKPTVATLRKKAMDYTHRPLTDFNKFEALEMLENLEHGARDSRDEKAEYYRVACQTARIKIDYPKEHFRSLLSRLLGDKDHQTVFEAVAKVEKSMAKWRGSGEQWRGPGGQWRGSGDRMSTSYGGWPRRNGPGPRCYYCDRVGHIAANCFNKRRDQRPGPYRRYQPTKNEAPKDQ